MTNYSRGLLTVAVVGILVLTAACGGGSDDEGGGDVAGSLSFSLALAADQIDAGAAIPLTVTLKNESGGAVTVARPAIVPSMVYLEVTREGGEVVPFDGPWPRLRPLAANAFVELAAGDTVDHEFDLAGFYTLSAATYTVVAYYRNPQDGAHVGLGALVIADADEVASNTVTLEVR
jgi:hypothetical protein